MHKDGAILFSVEGGLLDELHLLVRDSGTKVLGRLEQKSSGADPDYYLGRGKREELLALIQRKGATLVVADDELSPRQERNLEKFLGVPVLDRTAIILDIFARRANSYEGKLQVELAQLQYNMSRMRGLWTHLERLGAGIGTRGPGESQIETDRRLARKRISAIEDKLSKSSRSRETGRKERLNSSFFKVAFVGYTNAGKSSLMEILSGSEVASKDRLFYTLDPLTRKASVSGYPFLFSDTVGFIQKLPHSLINAFRSTLRELEDADLLLHVIDASAGEGQIKATRGVLSGLGLDNKPELLVINKIDEPYDYFSFYNTPAIRVSAKTGEGMDILRQKLIQFFYDNTQEVELHFPWNEGGRLSALHACVGQVQRANRPDGVVVKTRLRSSDLGRYQDLL